MIISAVAVLLFNAASEMRWVAADVANIRREPSETSAVSGRVRINTVVYVERSSDGWLHARSEPAAGEVGGYLLADLTADAPIDPA